MNNEQNYTMKSLISPKHKHLLWKDECGDDFLLLNYAEVYRYSKNILRLQIWSSKKRSWLRRQGWILNEFDLDEGFSVIDVSVSNLDEIINQGAFTRRPHLNGKWLKQKEIQLAQHPSLGNPDVSDAVRGSRML